MCWVGIWVLDGEVGFDGVGFFGGWRGWVVLGLDLNLGDVEGKMVELGFFFCMDSSFWAGYRILGRECFVLYGFRMPKVGNC